MSSYDDVSKLIDDELVAYYIYVKVLRGDDLVGNQAISPKRVTQMRDEWLGTVKKLHDAGVNPEFLRQMALGIQINNDLRKAAR